MKAVATAMSKDYIEVKIDSRMQRSGDVIKRIRKERRGGIPWMVILDADGKELVTSDGPKGNVGCPVRDHEIDWFMKMVAKTSQHMSDTDRATIEQSLRDYAAKILSR
jgi:hypothetical protein